MDIYRTTLQVSGLDYVRNFGPETCNVALLYMSTDEDDDLMYCTCCKYCMGCRLRHETI